VAVRGVAFVVFLLPVVISIAFGSVVMGEILKEPERELNMWPFKFSESGTTDVGSGSVKIVSLKDNYSILESISVQVLATGSGFDCGDLYITIYDLGFTQKQVVTQSGYFDQCFAENNLLLPIDGEFSEKIEGIGFYEIVIEMNDKNYKSTITTSEKFSVT